MTNNNTNQVKIFFDGYADGFDKIYDDDYSNKGIVKFLIDKYLRKSIYTRFDYTIKSLDYDKFKNILDIGCGSGRYCHYLANKNKYVDGIDISYSMIDLAQRISDDKKISNFTNFSISSVQDFIITKQYDAAIFMGFFDYIEKPIEIFNLLNNQQNLNIFASFPKKNHILTYQRKIRYSMNNCPLYFYSKIDLINLMKSLGKENYKIIDLGRDFVLDLKF